MILSIVFVAPVEIPRVHASPITGLVCLADPTASASLPNPCPTAPPVFSGPVGQQIRVGVFISGSNATAGFDITLLTNHTYLAPAYFSANTIDLTGTVLPGPAVVVNLCVGGQLITGSTCADTDSIDTIHLAAAAAFGLISPNPISGLLFTAIYNITRVIPSGGQPVGFQTPLPPKANSKTCTATSVSGFCVSIANGSTTLDSETIQTGTFDNSFSATSMPFVSVSANATSFGPEFPGVSNHVNVTARVMNGYSINSTNPVQFTEISPAGLTVSPTSGTCNTPGVPCSIVLTISATGPGNYSLIVLGNYHTVDLSGRPDTLASVVTLTLDVYDFGFVISPTVLQFNSGEIGSATVNLSSQNGFSGVIALSTNLVVPTGMTIAYFPSTITVGRGQSVTSTITFNASPKTQTIFRVRVNAAYPGRVKTSALLTITVNPPVNEFYLFAITRTIGPVDATVSGSANVLVGYANNFTGTVGLSVSPSTLASLNQTSVTSSHNVTLTGSANVASNYGVTVKAFNSTVSTSMSFTLIVVDFNLTASPNPINVGQGSFKTTSVSVKALNGFASSVTLATVQSAGLTATIVPNSVLGSGNALLNVTAAAGMTVGQYTVNVTGTSSPLSHIVQVNVTVVQNNFGIQAAPVSLAAYPGQNVTSTVTLSSLFGFAGTISLSVQAPAQVKTFLNTTSVSLSSGGSRAVILKVNSLSSGTFTFNVTGVSGALKHFTLVSFRSNIDVSFAVTLPYPQATISEGSTGSVPVKITSENGFTGNVTLTFFVIKPTGFAGVGVPNATLTPSKLILSPNTSQNITLAITVLNNVVSQNFGINVTGTSGSLGVGGPILILNVPPPGISIVPSPSTITVGPGARGNATVTLTALNGLFGPVSLSLVSSAGVTCSVTRLSIILKRDGSNTTSLSCTGPVGQNSVQIVGSGTTPYGGSISQTGSASFVVASFALSSTPTGVLVNTGQQGNAKITVSWTNSYNGAVTFHLVPTSGLNASIDSATLSGSGSVMVHVSSATAGTYSLVVNATSGPYSQTTTLTVTVSAVSGTSIDPVILYSGIGVGVAAAGAGAGLLLRRRGKRSRVK